MEIDLILSFPAKTDQCMDGYTEQFSFGSNKNHTIHKELVESSANYRWKKRVEEEEEEE